MQAHKSVLNAWKLTCIISVLMTRQMDRMHVQCRHFKFASAPQATNIKSDLFLEKTSKAHRFTLSYGQSKVNPIQIEAI
jgi:hypothetical protein